MEFERFVGMLLGKEKKRLFVHHNGFGLCVGGLLKPKTVCQHQSLLIAQMFLFALSAH